MSNFNEIEKEINSIRSSLDELGLMLPLMAVEQEAGRIRVLGQTIDMSVDYVYNNCRLQRNLAPLICQYFNFKYTPTSLEWRNVRLEHDLGDMHALRLFLAECVHIQQLKLTFPILITVSNFCQKTYRLNTIAYKQLAELRAHL